MNTHQPKRNRLLSKVLVAMALILASQAQAQDSLILKGKVVNLETSEPLLATVKVDQTGESTLTDISGTFILKTTASLPLELEIQHEGYKSQKVTVIDPNEEIVVKLVSDAYSLEELVVTSRRREEKLQDVPIPVSVVSGKLVEDAGAFNVNRIKEVVPTVQLYSSNPRNTTLNIRGLGSTFGLTNDGIDPGVGFYVDGVYYARPAATAVDFIDLERIEVIRGPQGTLFGKNTTAGAFNITTRKPTFTTGGRFELTYGNFGFIQAKASINGPLSKSFAGRISFSGTQRNGLVYNVYNSRFVNDMNNLGVRGQLRYRPSDKVDILFTGDYNEQKPNGFSQVVAGVTTTQRAGYRQFDAIIADLNYKLVSENGFDRLVDQNTTWKSNNDIAGLALNADFKIGPGTLTSITAWRYWNWDPSNDRDFIGLSVLRKSQAPSKHDQFSQEVRYSGNISKRLSGVVGVYGLYQNLRTAPYHVEESGEDQWRFAQNTTSPLWATPGLLDGYGIRTKSSLLSTTAAVFAQADWEFLKGFHFLPGIRYNYDRKQADYDRQTYGGLQTNDPALLALQRSVYSNQAYTTDVTNENWTGQLSVSYRPSDKFNSFATYSTSYKPVGVNLSGLPASNGQPLLELAEVKPEYVKHIEFGIKTSPIKKATFNVTAHDTRVDDYQTLVQTPDPGVNRGYLANAEEVRVWGVEVDASYAISKRFNTYGAVAYTDARYEKFTNAPVPLEEVGGTVAFKDISGGKLPGVSDWAGSLGGEVSSNEVKLLGQNGILFLGLDSYFRTDFSSNASPSKVLNINGYGLLNGRVGFRAGQNLTVSLWSRNLLSKDYYEQLLPAAGSAGQYAGVLGDQRTYGVTLRGSF